MNINIKELLELALTGARWERDYAAGAEHPAAQKQAYEMAERIVELKRLQEIVNNLKNDTAVKVFPVEDMLKRYLWWKKGPVKRKAPHDH